MEALFPSSSACLDLQELSQTALQIFYCSVFYFDARLMLLALCSCENICDCAIDRMWSV